jgi:hypothetical protein
MSRSLLRRTGTVAASAALLFACSISTASAKPDPDGPVPNAGSWFYPGNCVLKRIGSQLVRCDSLTGAGVSAPLWIPELLAATTVVPLKRGNY